MFLSELFWCFALAVESITTARAFAACLEVDEAVQIRGQVTFVGILTLATLLSGRTALCLFFLRGYYTFWCLLGLGCLPKTLRLFWEKCRAPVSVAMAVAVLDMLVN